jgi:hypothetical protein
MRPGSEVEVQSRFNGAWVRGFEVVDVLVPEHPDALRLRRRSDGAVLPALISREQVREVGDRT